MTYDGKRTGFCKGTKLKEKRALYKETRQSLQRRNTPSSRRRLRAIGRRESRYVSNENHKLAKTLVAGYGPGTTFVLEDLSGVREATARVRRKDRYISVSWPYYDLQQKLEYKARIAGCIQSTHPSAVLHVARLTRNHVTEKGMSTDVRVVDTAAMMTGLRQ